MSEVAESWRPVVGFEGRYEVSDAGSVRRASDGGGHPALTPLKPQIHLGYATVILSVRGRRFGRQIHCLVMAAFVGPRPTGYHIDHGNSVRDDNRLANLEYVTPSENSRRSVLRRLVTEKLSRRAQRWRPEELPWDPSFHGPVAYAASLAPSSDLLARTVAP